MSKNMCFNCEKGPVPCYYAEDALIECKYFKKKVFDSIMRGLAEVKAMQEPKYGEWIKVSDRTPDANKLVLCCGYKGGYFLGMALYPQPNVGESIYMIVPNARSGRYAVSWMPLPEPPKEI